MAEKTQETVKVGIGVGGRLGVEGGGGSVRFEVCVCSGVLFELVRKV